jgi:PLP dependent protein
MGRPGEFPDEDSSTCTEGCTAPYPLTSTIDDAESEIGGDSASILPIPSTGRRLRSRNATSGDGRSQLGIPPVESYHAHMTSLSAQLQANTAAVEARIAAACARGGRSPTDITLVAVTKYAELDWVRGLYDLGYREFGESRPQQLIDRARQLPTDIRWHLIGHLQRNKAASVIPVTQLIHSVDSLRLAQQLSRDAEKLGRSVPVLLEVNVSGEEAKDGFAVDELRTQWETLRELPGLRLDGLMTMAPLSEDAETSRPVFTATRELRDHLQALAAPHPLHRLSMGMSGDFEVGIECGATHIRVGSAIWQGLNAE